jgi:hypothetical protein
VFLFPPPSTLRYFKSLKLLPQKEYMCWHHHEERTQQIKNKPDKFLLALASNMCVASNVAANDVPHNNNKNEVQMNQSLR